MGRRRKARELVLQALYEAEFSGKPWEVILREQAERRASADETVSYANELLAAVMRYRAEIDDDIRSSLSNWELDRVSLIDKNILRFALTELRFFPSIPTRVVINEAIEIAHKYSSGEAGKFVNGILDRLAKDYRKDDA